MSKEPSRDLVDGADVILVRGERVMLDARVAEAFGTETKRVNEAVSRNEAKFGPEHCFQLTEAEFTALRSQIATSSTGRGGTRYLPRVFTVKGVARLATVLDTPKALKATDLIIDTFLQVYEQLKRGRRTVAVPEPGRFRASREHADEIGKLRSKLANSLSRLLDTIVDAEGQSARQVAHSLGSNALANIQERLRTKGLENTKLEADTSLVLAQAEKALAEARKARAEAEGIDIANLERRISAVRKVSETLRDLEPDDVVGLIDTFDTEPLRLPAPDEDKRRKE
ncbi:MAG: ORF6N domain-containing protein [Proteobacteria bacterium]|nr:ORF6N domain-containing protein [Pseudomonadota bacterium]